MLIQEKPLVIERLVTCSYCQSHVSARNLTYHVNNRCKKAEAVRTAAVKAAKLAKKKKAKPPVRAGSVQPTLALVAPTPRPLKKRVLVRSRLERLFRDLEQEHAEPDESSLANLFKSFYTVYVWKKDTTVHTLPGRREIDDDGNFRTSIRTVSGGLPSLGKRAK